MSDIRLSEEEAATVRAAITEWAWDTWAQRDYCPRCMAMLDPETLKGEHADDCPTQAALALLGGFGAGGKTET